MGAIDGLISGLNTTQIISQLMQVERLPEQQLTNHKTASQTLVSTMQGLNSLMTALQTAAKAFVPDSITEQSAWGSTIGSSSASTLAGVTTGPTALPGSARFTVQTVASAASVVSSGTVGSLTDPVGSGPIQIVKGAASIGLSALAPGSTLSAGTHNVTVTQASAAATLTGSNVLQPSVVIGGSADPLEFSLDEGGTPSTFTVPNGTYTPAQLAAEVGRASGGKLVGSIDDAGRLQVSTAREGSDFTLNVTTGNSTLGLTAQAEGRGRDGIVALDNVAQPPLKNIGAGEELALAGANGDTV